MYSKGYGTVQTQVYTRKGLYTRVLLKELTLELRVEYKFLSHVLLAKGYSRVLLMNILKFCSLQVFFSGILSSEKFLMVS